MRSFGVFGCGLVVCFVGAQVLAACSSDNAGSDVTCGYGTVLQAGKCMLQCGPGTVLVDGQCMVGSGASGAAGQGSMEEAGESGVGTPAAGGGAGRAGAGNGSGGKAEVGGASGVAGAVAAGGSSGSSGAAAAGGTSNVAGAAGALGVSGAGGASATPHWLAFNHSDGDFAYDVTRFPSDSGLVQLSAKAGFGFSVGPWSPDGRWLVYLDRSDLYVRDMSSAQPGPAQLLLAAPAFPTGFGPRFQWSADSKSLAVVAGTVLYVFDPTIDAPPIHTLTTTLASACCVYSVVWAPAGNHLEYIDSAGTHVVPVQAGAPGADMLLSAGTSKGWSPDGQSLVSTSLGNVTLTNITGAAPVTVTVSAPTVAVPSTVQLLFNADGSELAYVGMQTRSLNDIYLVKLKPTVGSPVLLSAGLNATTSVTGVSSWSTSGRWIVFGASDSSAPGSSRLAVDVSGAAPSAPVSLKPADAQSYQWLPGQPNKALSGTSNSTLFGLADFSNPTADPVSVTGAFASALSPATDVFAYATTGSLVVRDLDALTPAVSVPIDLSGSTTFHWSPDGNFIAAVSGSSSYQQRLVRLSGATPSTAVPIYGTSTNVAGAPVDVWQPVFR
jgi:hypothetical protein